MTHSRFSTKSAQNVVVADVNNRFSQFVYSVDEPGSGVPLVVLPRRRPSLRTVDKKIGNRFHEERD